MLAFLKKILNKNSNILIINLINYKYKNITKIFIFALFIYNKIFIAYNISIFKNLNIIQIIIKSSFNN